MFAPLGYAPLSYGRGLQRCHWVQDVHQPQGLAPELWDRVNCYLHTISWSKPWWHLALAAAGEPNLNVSLITACQESCCNQDCELHCTAGEKAKKPWGRAKSQMHSSYGSLKVPSWLSIPREVGPDREVSHSKCNSTHLHPGVLGQVVEGKGDCVRGGVDPSKKHVQCHDRCCPSVATSF